MRTERTGGRFLEGAIVVIRASLHEVSVQHWTMIDGDLHETTETTRTKTLACLAAIFFDRPHAAMLRRLFHAGAESARASMQQVVCTWDHFVSPPARLEGSM